jgi:hypothetical protein
VTGAPFLSIVLTGRNDGYGSDFIGRLLRTAGFNHRHLTARGLPHEFVLVEWAPPSDRPLLSDILCEQLPELGRDVLRTVTVDAEYQGALSLNPKLAYLEYMAKNVGVRRASAPFILASNCDIYLGRVVLDVLARRALRPGVVYRAARFDLKLGLDESLLDWDALEEVSNLATPPKEIRPPLFGPGTGDFILADAPTWQAMRGFNEVYRGGRVGLDRNFVVKARSSGIAIADIGGPVYHANHPGSNRLVAQTQKADAAPPPAATPRDIVYQNPDGWGLADAPAIEQAPGRTRLAFSWSAVPPLVDLHRLLIPAARGADAGGSGV